MLNFIWKFIYGDL
uniref:Uncharacterized protein n=1 Tax=Lepeophtheirus salmonis TaxID=72036 RepID=A0A0K2TDF0_LEPSM